MTLADHPRLPPTADRVPPADPLAPTYRLLADLFVYPEAVDRDALLAGGREEVLPALREHVDEEAAGLVATFLDEYEDVSVDEYVETLELEPACPLYLGHYAFDEPETCREIADSDRNQYMVELNGIYEHFGFELADELPDFLPAMVEFLWLTLPERDDELRREFADKLHSMLPGMREQFEDHGTPYWRLVAALEQILAYDIEMSARVDEADVDRGDPAVDEPGTSDQAVDNSGSPDAAAGDPGRPGHEPPASASPTGGDS